MGQAAQYTFKYNTLEYISPGLPLARPCKCMDVPLRALYTFTHQGTTLLATGSDDTTVRIWDPATGAHHHTLTGHQSWVNSICPVLLGSVAYLVTASRDRTVRIWNPAKEAGAIVAATRDPALSVAYADRLLFVGTATGVLAIQLNPEFLEAGPPPERPSWA